MTKRKPVVATIPPDPLRQEQLGAYVDAGTCPFCGRGPYKVLAQHTHVIHGVDKRELREMLGVCWTTSISPLVTEERRAVVARLIAEGRRPPGRGPKRGTKYQLSQAGLEKRRALVKELQERRKSAAQCLQK